jgi:endonuclease YncB( thermonuclease family)
MRNNIRRKTLPLASALILLLAMLTVFGTPALAANVTWNGSTPPTIADGDTITIGGTPSGTLIVPAGDSHD